MASTPDGAALTELHRRRQLALRAATLRDLLTLWRAYDTDNPGATWPAVETALVALIQARWAVSAGLAAAYYTAFRAAEGVDGQAAVVPTRTPPADTVGPPLRLYGLIGARRLVAAGRTDAKDVTFTKLAGEVTRQTLDGGRATTLDALRSDPKALGYLRVTAASPCAYCALLAARGPVYLTKERALLHGGKARYHRSCGCTAEPVFTKDQPWPGRGREFERLYQQAKQRASAEGGATPDIEFRRLIEGR